MFDFMSLRASLFDNNPMETDRLLIHALDFKSNKYHRQLESSFNFVSETRSKEEVYEYLRFEQGCFDDSELEKIVQYLSENGQERYEEEYLKNVMHSHTIDTKMIYFVGVEKDTDKPVLTYAVQGDLQGCPRLSYYAALESRQKGLASEGYQALLKVLEQNAVHINFAEVSVDNRQSIKFLIRNGFRAVARVNKAITNFEPHWHKESFWMKRTSSARQPGLK